MSNENNIGGGNGSQGAKKNDRRRYYHRYHKKNGPKDNRTENKDEIKTEADVLEQETELIDESPSLKNAQDGICRRKNAYQRFGETKSFC